MLVVSMATSFAYQTSEQKIGTRSMSILALDFEILLQQTDILDLG